MDWLIAVLEKFKWQLTTVVTVIPLAIIFRQQIGDLIANITSIEIDPKKRNWKINFGQRVKLEQKRATVIPRQITASHAVPAPVPMIEGTNQSGRDLVLEAWGAVKQAVYDGCIANEVPVAPTAGAQEAVRRLGNAKGLSTELIKMAELVIELGQEVAGDNRLRPEDDDARAYWNLAHNVAHWMALSVLSAPKVAEPPPPPPAPSRRPTVVGGNLVQPTAGTSTTALVGVSGPVRGQRFSIDKPTFRLGRNPNNDLRIAADDSVSGDHAYLRYEKGGLFLSDLGSLNGTFLNEQRIAGAPLMVRYGDRIRLGASVFELVGTSANSRGSEEKKDEALKVPSDRSIVR